MLLLNTCSKNKKTHCPMPFRDGETFKREEMKELFNFKILFFNLKTTRLPAFQRPFFMFCL
jgi:hypothetical protein